MRAIFVIFTCLLLGACGAPGAYTRATAFPLAGAFACAQEQMTTMDYEIVLADSVGRLLQGRREITGIRESARRGAAAATELITVGLTAGPRTRYDQLTVLVYTRTYPLGNTVETTADMLIVGEADLSRDNPSDDARADARVLADRCSPRV